MMTHEQNSRQVNFLFLLMMIGGLVVAGTLGYMFIEGWRTLDALYMVVITLATVGFREVHPLSPAGEIFTMLLIVFGLITIYYVVRHLGEYLIADKLEEHFKTRRMEKSLRTMSGHYVICGFGRVGSQVARELAKEPAEFVVIERDPALVTACEEEGWLCVPGDATDEAILRRAGAMTARGLIICLGRDSDTVLTIITARGLNNDLFIVARANRDNAAGKLVQVGANRVISPHQIGGFRMASFALNPEVADFLDDVQDLSNREVQIDDVMMARTSPAAGHSIANKLSNRTYGVSVLAIHRPDGKTVINPIGDTVVEAGDRLVLLGTKDKLAVVVKLLGVK